MLVTRAVLLEWQGDGDAALIERAFAKSMADARKEWLRGYDPDVFVDHSTDMLSYSDFIDKEVCAAHRSRGDPHPGDSRPQSPGDFIASRVCSPLV